MRVHNRYLPQRVFGVVCAPTANCVFTAEGMHVAALNEMRVMNQRYFLNDTGKNCVNSGACFINFRTGEEIRATKTDSQVTTLAIFGATTAVGCADGSVTLLPQGTVLNGHRAPITAIAIMHARMATVQFYSSRDHRIPIL